MHDGSTRATVHEMKLAAAAIALVVLGVDLRIAHGGGA